MKTILKMAPLVGAMALLAACGTTMEQRAATGAIGGNTGSTVAGAAIGGVVGAATTPRRPN